MLVVEPGIGEAAFRVTTADRHRGHPMETRGYRSPREEKTSGKGKCVHTKQQHNAAQAVNSPDAYANGEKLASMKQLHAQIAAVSNALTELEASEDKEVMQPLESRLTDLKARLHGARPIGQHVDGLRGVISRCQKRLAETEIAKAEAEATIIKETEDMASYRTTRRTRTTPHYIHGVSQRRRAE